MPKLVPSFASFRSVQTFTLALSCASELIMAQPAGAAGQACPRTTTTTQTPYTPPTGTTTTGSSSTVTSGGTIGSNAYPNSGTGQNGNQPPRPPTTRPSVQIPDVDSSAVDVAKAEDAAAHTELTKAQTALSEITKKFQDTFNARPDVVEATSKVASSKAAYDAAAAPVLAALTSSADYQTARATADEAKQNVETVKTDPSATPEMRMTAAKEALTAKDTLTKMRAAALASDSKASAARTDLTTQTQALTALHQQYDDSLKQDPDYASAKSAFDDAKAKATAADQKLADTKTAYARAVAARNAAIAEQRKLDRDYAAQQQAAARR